MLACFRRHQQAMVVPTIVSATDQGSAANPNHARNGPSTRKTAAANAPSEVARGAACGREVLHDSREERIIKIIADETLIHLSSLSGCGPKSQAVLRRNPDDVWIMPQAVDRRQSPA